MRRADTLVVVDMVINRIQRHGGIRTYFLAFIEFLERHSDFDIYLVGQGDYRANRLGRYHEMISSGKIDPKRLYGYKHIIYVSSYYRPPSFRDKRFYIVTVLHDLIPLFRKKDGIKRYLLDFALMWLIRRSVSCSQFIACVSRQTYDLALGYFNATDPAKFHSIDNGIFDSFSRVATNKPARSHDALYIGSRSDYKRFYLAPLLATEAGCRSMIIVGGGALARSEEELLRNAKLPYVHLQNVGPEELIQLYDRARCLLYPSLLEGFGLPPREAVARGCPVICDSEAYWSAHFKSPLKISIPFFCLTSNMPRLGMMVDGAHNLVDNQVRTWTDTFETLFRSVKL